MCVIAFCESGVEAPSEDVLRRCWEANPQGAGFMWSDGKRVRIRKGFMSLKELTAALNVCGRSMANPLVIHFRTATSGLSSPEMTHPFPVETELKWLTLKGVDCSFGVAHNGVLGRGEGDLSDTAVFVRDILAPFRSKLLDPAAIKLLEAVVRGDRLAILGFDGLALKIGSWEARGKVWFSNTFWEYSLAFSQDIALGSGDDDWKARVRRAKSGFDYLRELEDGPRGKIAAENTEEDETEFDDTPLLTVQAKAGTGNSLIVECPCCLETFCVE